VEAPIARAAVELGNAGPAFADCLDGARLGNESAPHPARTGSRDATIGSFRSSSRVAQERLQVEIDELAGGHLLALANPNGLADQLVEYLQLAPRA
jgi:hypothetical protein